jgi:hypothetical protein
MHCVVVIIIDLDSRSINLWESSSFWSLLSFDTWIRYEPILSESYECIDVL